MSYLKELPPIPHEVARSLSDWVMGSKTFKNLNLAKKFYQSLGIKQHKEFYYRGLRISKTGLIELFNNGHVNLKKRKMESWTCDFDVAYMFTRKSSKNNCGIVLKKKVPDNKVIINLDLLWRKYDKIYDDVLLGKLDYDVLGGRYALDTLTTIRSFKGECEVVTENICNKCKMEDITTLSWQNILLVDDVYFIDALIEFLDDLKSTEKSFTKYLNAIKLYSSIDDTDIFEDHGINLLRRSALNKNFSKKWGIVQSL